MEDGPKHGYTVGSSVLWGGCQYRQRIDACLSWAQEAGAERVVCLELAQAWLQAALADTEGNKQIRRAD